MSINPFANYASEKAAPEPRRKREGMAPSPLGKKIAEKQRLSRAYRKWQTQNAREIMTQEPRLGAFAAWLRKCSDRVEMIDGLRDSWLPQSPVDIRVHALRLVDARCNKLNKAHGFEALDDPFPPETSAYFEAKAILLPRGMA
jgi:hypothetical protein